MKMSVSKAERTRALRYKRPALASMGFEFLTTELDDIIEACSDVHYFTDDDNETLLNALDGDEDEAYEFKIAFADLEVKAEQLSNMLRDVYDFGDSYGRTFNDCTVALIGNRYRTVGFDMVEEDYFALTSYEQELAQTEAGKRLMRLTKAEMISTIGQCMGTLLAFYDLRQSYDYLKATFDILRDENTSLLRQIKEIEAAYDAADETGWYGGYPEVKQFDGLLASLPERAWVE